LQNDCLRIANSPPCLYVVGLKAQIARRMAGLLIRRLFDTFPGRRKSWMGWQSVRVRKLSGVLQNTSSNVPSLLFVVPTLSVGRRFSKSICLRSQESGTRTCGKESVRERALSSSQSSEH